MGSFDKKTKTSSKTSGTATTTPNVPAFIQQPAQNFYSSVSNLMAEPVNPAGTQATPNQRAAFTGASALSTPNNAILDAMQGTRGLMNFAPDSVQAGQLRDTNLDPYMNPYISSVIDAALADIERSRATATAGNQGAATMAKAYGGSRHGVVDALTNEAAIREAGSTSAGLRASGFDSARTAALADISNKLATDTGNADRGVTAAGLRLNAANQLGAQGVSADNNTRANLTTQASLGEMERQIATENDPVQARIERLRQIAALLGIDPGMFTGQTINQTGTQSGSTTQKGGFQVGWSAKDGLQLGFGG